MSDFTVVILAGGKGSRMKSDLPKVLHKIGNLELILHVVKAAKSAGAGRIIVVTPPDNEQVRSCVSAFYSKAEFATQKQQLGTGNALMAATELLKNQTGKMVVLYGDTPLISAETVRKVYDNCSDESFSLVGMYPANTFGYGRMLESTKGVERIIEEIDASEQEKQIKLCYSGIIGGAVDKLMPLLAEIKPSPRKGEYYITDVIWLGGAEGLRSNHIVIDESEMMGVNDRAQLASAEAAFQSRMRREMLNNGITMRDPSTVYFSHDTQIESDVEIHQNVVFGAGVKISSGSEIKAFSHIDGAKVGRNCVIGPFARLRPQSELADDVHIGNFVEIKKTKIGKGSKANHLTYIGDAMIGADVNVGAGTITCNYDGYKKYETHIGNGAFIGSNTALVAPVKIGDGAIVGAGSVITSAVPDDALAITRSEQRNKAGWAYVFRKKQDVKGE